MKTFFHIRSKTKSGLPGVALRSLGQSTIELALVLPTFVLLLVLIISAFKINQRGAQQTANFYAQEIQNFHNGLVFDPGKQMYVSDGQYVENIAADALINPAQIAKDVAGILAQLGANELLSQIPFNTQNFFGAFGEGFSTTLVDSVITQLAQNGNLNDYQKLIENAAWQGGTSAFSSGDATKFFQGDNPTASSAQEFFGSGAQQGLISFTKSDGSWQAGVSGAAGGMLNSDTTKNWVNDPTSDAGTQMLKGAGVGALQSSINGAVKGNLSVKTILLGGASGVVKTNAFANALPFTGSDPKHSAVYGAVNGAFSSAASGANWKTVIAGASSGALGSSQATSALGGSKSFTYGLTKIAGGGLNGLIQGGNIKAVGQGAITSGLTSVAGWVGNSLPPSMQKVLKTSTSAPQVDNTLNQPAAANQTAQDPAFNQNMDNSMNAVSDSMTDMEYIKVMQDNPKPAGSST